MIGIESLSLNTLDYMSANTIHELYRKTSVFLDALVHREYLYLIWGLSPTLFRILCRVTGYKNTQIYAIYQKLYYEHFARIDEKNLVVGHFEANESYDYEKYLLKPFSENTKHIIALDFGCGPGRMVRRMSKFVNRVDGVDISENNITKAKIYTKNIRSKTKYFVNNGYDLAGIPSDTYDLVYTTIALHHIPIHKTRMNLIREFLRVLKIGGQISLQMVFQKNLKKLPPGHSFSCWRENPYDANGTNGTYDVVITPKSLKQVREDLRYVGFKNISFNLALPPVSKEVGLYDNWIFIYARK
ncbi:MAG: hypothetical protein UX80_C0002G0043 [Candidatus Amesbacteria bacterium GW2011_GWA2_47_11b]|uniref:Methyltransferase type 11 domain-containing protein n=2 Tax=Candidatus Amesiibacteriota TaxID=1752730 RepID=A0A0G1SLM1_9BACT|nr:MAG: hypothetical protein UT95_C0003G0019 [Candidatus Curtissbacteria bacterium GW2011_GWB1_40_28]KKU29406.1 MAG: hypothetical protein UX42_C0001G0158 [Microgenomates group bacterium GW2011_GWC1_46_20]KKU58508.1 MAG: hypothetical protein UX80_C0002G0043 [Candidatus Amesbacteria bacterium GW2011_GWA2_47_11b]KKU70347.1 MAG: hypothetical protein UX92_C0001G0015 [Candidatus Amesbacteria bacterium GW2011_GWA1_47_20]HCH59286.1 hypothetical protein [Candidatus Zambryskibacteria bacterium]